MIDLNSFMGYQITHGGGDKPSGGGPNSGGGAPGCGCIMGVGFAVLALSAILHVLFPALP